MTRGIRNHNPGNIQFNPANNWLGQLPHDPSIEPRFCRFDSPVNGIRALARLLLSYYRRHGLDTVQGILRRWAPAVENDTGAYVRAVEAHLALALGEQPGARLSVDHLPVLRALTVAIIHHENGRQPYSSHQIDEGIGRALA